jgi:hypothetical protein
VNCLGVIIALLRPLQGPALQIDLCFARRQIFIGDACGYILFPLISNSRTDPNLPVQGQVQGSDVFMASKVSIERNDSSNFQKQTTKLVLQFFLEQLDKMDFHA